MLDNGAPIDAINDEGKTPLHFAIKTQNYHAALLLLNQGANPLILDHTQQSPMDYYKSQKNKWTPLENLFKEKSKHHVQEMPGTHFGGVRIDNTHPLISQTRRSWFEKFCDKVKRSFRSSEVRYKPGFLSEMSKMRLRILQKI